MVISQERTRSWEYTITNNMVPHFAPGGGLFSTFTKLGMQRVTLSLKVAAKDADDFAAVLMTQQGTFYQKVVVKKLTNERHYYPRA